MNKGKSYYTCGKCKCSSSTRTLIIVLCSIFCFLILLFLTVIVYVVPTGLLVQIEKNPEPKYSHYLRDIVKLNPEVATMSINEIALLGSHNALTDKISKNSVVNRDLEKENFIPTSKAIEQIAKGLFVRFSKCQVHDVYTQLNRGIRYIDARITTWQNKFYTTHYLISEELSLSLLKILKFLSENPGEFLVFTITHYYHTPDYTYSDLFDYISSVKYSGKSLLDYVPLGKTNDLTFRDLTYNDITNNGANAAVLILVDLYRKIEDGFMYWDYIPQTFFLRSKWHQTFLYDVLMDKVEAEISFLSNNNSYSDYIRVNQFISTLTFSNISQAFASVFSWSIVHSAKRNLRKSLANSDFNISFWADMLDVTLIDYATGTENSIIMEKLILYMVEKQKDQINS